MKRCLKIIILILFAFNNLKAQHPYFYTINDENGLPSNEVYQVLQDSFGFIWIGCDAGLYRYDGFRFMAYTNSEQNSKSISNLYLDKNQNVWCQNFTGQIFKANANSNYLDIIYDGSTSSKVQPIYCVDDECNAWIITDSICTVIDDSKKIIKRIDNKNFKTKSLFFADAKIFNNQFLYLINYLGELTIYNIHNGQYNKYEINNNTNERYKILNIKNNIYLFVETLPERQYKLLDITNGKKELLANFNHQHNSGNNYIITACQDHLMLCTSAGVVILDEKFKLNPAYKTLFEKHKISYSYCDKEGNYWFSSLQDGIFVIPSLDVQIFNKNNSILNDNNISAINKIKDSILCVGNYSGELYYLNVVDSELNVLPNNTQNTYRAARKMYFEKDKLYAARGLFTISEKNKISNIPTLTNSRDFEVNGDTIYYTRSDISGFISKENGEWKQNILRRKDGKKVIWDKANQSVYYACTDGFFVYKNNQIKEIKYKNESVFGSALQIDGQQIWVGTNTKGVLVLEKDSVVLALNSNNLLSDDNVKSLFKRGDTAWVACRKGLNVLDLKKGNGHVINEYDGLAFKEINNIIVIGQSIYLATIKGLVKMPLDLKWKNRTPPSIKILMARKNNLPLDITQKIDFNYNDNNLTIDFIAVAFRSRNKFYYKYRLKNFDKTWRYVNSNTPRINFSSLPPGEYIFEVIAVNEDGVRSRQPAQLHISVYAPIWEKWWFYLILSFVFVGIIALIFRARLNFVKRNAEVENKLIASQLTALKAQMNPHFMYNALNSIQALNIKNEIKKSNFYLGKFSRLMRKVLDASGEEAITVQDEIEILELYLELEKLRFGEEFNYDIIIGNEIDTYKLLLPPMLLQPFIENAIKHGLLHKKGEKRIDIEFKLTDKLVCIITDNGVGRKKVQEIQQRLAENHKSFATQATKKRIDLLNSMTKDKYNIEIIDLYDGEIPIGTQVKVYIPI